MLHWIDLSNVWSAQNSIAKLYVSIYPKQTLTLGRNILFHKCFNTCITCSYLPCLKYIEIKNTTSIHFKIFPILCSADCFLFFKYCKLKNIFICKSPSQKTAYTLVKYIIHNVANAVCSCYFFISTLTWPRPYYIHHRFCFILSRLTAFPILYLPTYLQSVMLLLVYSINYVTCRIANSCVLYNINVPTSINIITVL